MYGPESISVPFLGRFAKRRALTPRPRPLSIPLKKLLVEQDKLFVFLNFMKAQNAIHVLQIYLTLGKDLCVHLLCDVLTIMK